MTDTEFRSDHPVCTLRSQMTHSMCYCPSLPTALSWAVTTAPDCQKKSEQLHKGRLTYRREQDSGGGLASQHMNTSVWCKV